MSRRRPSEVLSEQLSAVRRRFDRIQRREASEFQRWIQNTTNLLHLSVVVLVPLVLAAVTFLSNRVQTLSFLLFPPLAAGVYTLFSDPEGQYADPIRFVASLTAGAVCGLAAQVAVTAGFGGPPIGPVRPESAALAVFLTGVVTWAAGIESPSSFSTALLVLVTGAVDPLVYVASIMITTTFVAAVFWVWREEFYDRRAEYLYETVRGDDHVLVPMRGETATQTAFFGARLAAAHDAGKIVLLGIVDETRGAGDSEGGDSVDGGGDDTTDGVTPGESLPSDAADTVARLERCAATIRADVDVPCEVAVVSGAPVGVTIEAALNANCDLIATPYEAADGVPSTYLSGVFSGPIDAIALRSQSERRRWRRVLVLIARPGDIAHGMIDFAARLAGSGTVSVTTCIGAASERRAAETRLERLVETVGGDVETRVARSSVGSFLDGNAGSYDLVVLGSSGERSPASRLVSPPTHERLRDVDCDVAVFDRRNG